MKNLFYFLSKEYPATITVVKINKGVIDLDTGMRSETQDTRLDNIRAVVPPIKTFNAFLSKLSGRVILNRTAFLIKTISIIWVPETDYILYQGKQYRNLTVYDYTGYTIIEGDASV